MAQATTYDLPNPAGPTPLRRPASVRRTSSIDTSWPDGMAGPMRMHGHARDLFTPADGGAPRVLADDWVDFLASPLREITTIETSRSNDIAQGFVGDRGGGHLRREIVRLMPEENAGATPLHLLLDDFSGASLVAGWAWSRWTDQWREGRPGGALSHDERVRKMEGICSGFRPGSSALLQDGTVDMHQQSSTRVVPLPNPADPIGWHTLTDQAGVGMRRARRMDVWLDDRIRIDIGFQDSATAPDGGQRIAVHEYKVAASADPGTFELLTLDVDPRILPFDECPGAVANAAKMLGARLPDFRLEVLARLPGTLGCTHLNDVLRSLADAPALAARLRLALAESGAKVS
jgi:hypothetical protein